MTSTNPQIEKQLDALAEICCAKLIGEAVEDGDRSEDLLKALLKSGYVRKAGPSIQAEIESRAKKICREPAMHRGGALSGITSQLQEKFDDLQKWDSKQPETGTGPKTANISSTTDA